MRTMIGKRIGPVPIALVAVLALAAFISAGLWLVPNNGAQADGHELPDVTLDVNEELTISADDVLAALGVADETVTGITFAITSDQDGTAVTPGGTGTGLIAASLFSIADTGEFTTASDDTLSQAMALQADNTATITITADRAAVEGPSVVTAIDTEVSFDLTIVQNPIEIGGEAVVNPDTDTAGANTDTEAWPAAGDCVVAWDGTDLTSRMFAADPAVALEITAENNLVSGGDCTTDGDSVDVEFTNAAGTAGGVNYLIYVTGGDDFDDVMPQLGKGGLTEYAPFNVPAPTEFAGDDVDGKKVIEVSRDMSGSKGRVYVIGYAAGAIVETNNLGDDSTTFGADPTFRGGGPLRQRSRHRQVNRHG